MNILLMMWNHLSRRKKGQWQEKYHFHFVLLTKVCIQIEELVKNKILIFIGDKINSVPYNRPTVLKDLEFIGKTIYSETFTG